MQVNLQWTLRENVSLLLVQKSRATVSTLSHKAIKDPNGEKTQSIRRYSTEMKQDLATQSQNLSCLINTIIISFCRKQGVKINQVILFRY